jgi:hypothetical protein
VSLAVASPPSSVAKHALSLRSRVAELEQENARLQALAQKTASHDGNSRELVSEIEQLRARLAAAEQRERELSSQLSKRSMPVKTELSEPRLTTSPVRHPVFPTQLKSSDKTSASLSLLVSRASLKRICISTDIFTGPALRASFHIFGLGNFQVRGTYVWFVSSVQYSNECQLRCGFQDGLSLVHPTRSRLACPRYHGP